MCEKTVFFWGFLGICLHFCSSRFKSGSAFYEKVRFFAGSGRNREFRPPKKGPFSEDHGSPRRPSKSRFRGAEISARGGTFFRKSGKNPLDTTQNRPNPPRIKVPKRVFFDPFFAHFCTPLSAKVPVKIFGPKNFHFFFQKKHDFGAPFTFS